jgi:hypothetical protein
LLDLILGAHVDVDFNVQLASLGGILNSLHLSDANRRLSVELGGIRPLLSLLQTTTQEELIVLALKILANMSYGDGYTSNCVLLAGGGEVLVQILESGYYYYFFVESL